METLAGHLSAALLNEALTDLRGSAVSLSSTHTCVCVYSCVFGAGARLTDEDTVTGSIQPGEAGVCVCVVREAKNGAASLQMRVIGARM